MSPELYLSLPSVRLPSRAVPNAEIVARVRANFRGDEEGWRQVERAIRFVFSGCGSHTRYEHGENVHAVGTHAAEAGAAVLAEEGVAASAVDLLVYASIVREYFEPAVATEVAWRLGASTAAAYDVVAACAGPIVAIDTLRGKAMVDPAFRLALVSTVSLSEGFIGYDIQTPAELDELAAGLTIGQAATAFLVGREPFRRGGRVVGSCVEGVPAHHPLCRAPISGVFRSAGSAIFALAALVPGHVHRACERYGWGVREVDLFVLHQPSNRVLRRVAAALDVPQDRVPQLHGRYGNPEASAVPLTLRHLADEGRLRPGMKLILGSAAAGFTLGTVAVEWLG